MVKIIHDNSSKQLFTATLSDRDFSRLSKLIRNECGINIPEYKKTLIESRLQKRLRTLGLSSLSEYCSYLFSSQGMTNELTHMIDVITTNSTDFFRERAQFDYLVEHVLPELISKQGPGISKKLHIWSAGCSSGEEPYTLGIFLSEFSEKSTGNRSDFLILATDVSTAMLEKAKRGIYAHERVTPVPLHLRKKYLLRGRNNSKGLVRVVREVREVVKFRRLNLLDGDYGMREPMDIIFFRNVLIYFDRVSQEQVLRRVCHHLIPGGYIFMGHSETLNQFDVPLVQVRPAVYRKLV